MIFGLSIEELCDWIILIAAAGAALYKILCWLKFPVKWGKKKKEKIKEERKQEICGVLEEELPELFLEHDLETRQKYLNDRLNYLNEIKAEILSEIKSTLEEIKNINVEQAKQINVIHQGSKDMLRQRIMMIYHNYKTSKRITIYDREALDEAYKDYKAEGGNSYIDKYYNRTLSWETYYPDDEEN